MKSAMPMPLLGIMVTELPKEVPFVDSFSYQELCRFGLQAGIEVFVFSPNRIDWIHERLTGYTYQTITKEWVKKSYPLPDLIYDRCFFSTKAAYLDYRSHIRKLYSKSSIRFLGYGLSGKWEVLQMLRQDDYFHPYLPDTFLLGYVQEVLDYLERKGEVFIKPQGGSQGKGVLYIKQLPQSKNVYLLSGRDGRNLHFRLQFKEAAALQHWLRRFIGKRPYIFQEYLSLHTASNIAYDIRAMVQKNDQGHWQLTGMGIRSGQPGSITSNLHGGGIALEVIPFLEREFGPDQAKELERTLIELSTRIPPALEAAHGRLVELGIDLGIDRSGRIWILEVNSKPGRRIFTHLPSEIARKRSNENPIRYAAFLLRAQKKVPSGTEAFSTHTGMECPQGQQV
jgi:glutathione synthase/RimK-type ligase-like ATP-grasp enzyme